MIQINQIVNSIYSSNTFIVSSDNSSSAWLVDCGDAEPILKWCGLNGKELLGIFLTHVHFDHIYGLNAVLHKFPGCTVYTSGYGAEALYNDRKNLSFYHGQAIEYNGAEPIILTANDTIEIFPDKRVQVIETPGHNNSCLTYIIDNYIFTGDSYIPELKVVTNLPGGNKLEAEVSLARIKKLAENKIICAGHETK